MSIDSRFSAKTYIDNISKVYSGCDIYFSDDFPSCSVIMDSLYDKADISNIFIPITALEMLDMSEGD